MISRLAVERIGISVEEQKLREQISRKKESENDEMTRMTALNSSPNMNANNYNSLSPTQVDQLSGESTCSSSLSNGDLINDLYRNQANNSPNQQTVSRSPILIKYNYYDYNGARQEQENQNMNFQPAAASNGSKPIHRQLSPTFRQNLDQIVRSSQQQQQVQIKQQQQQVVHNQHFNTLQLARRYKLSSYEQRCLRCDKTVYQMDKVGPLKDFTFYHQNCFKCRECGTKLTLKTYFNNQQSSGDREVYCHRHCPKTGPGKLDNNSVGIRAALNAPKVFDPSSANLHHLAELMHFNVPAQMLISPPIKRPPMNGSQVSPSLEQVGPPNVDSRALHIAHAVQQTRNLQQVNNLSSKSQPHIINQANQQQQQQQQLAETKISQFINRRLEFLEPKQKLLEMRHREEEDALFKAFEMKWRKEESCISEQIRLEWQIELGKLFDKYKRQLSNISSTSAPSGEPQQLIGGQPISGRKVTEARLETDPKRLKRLLLEQLAAPGELEEPSRQQMIEFERLNLEKTMTIKLDRKKETLKRKLKEFERQATAELVEKQSREMLALISLKLDEFKEEQKRKIGSELEQFEAIESLANQLGSSLQMSVMNSAGQSVHLSSSLPTTNSGAHHHHNHQQQLNINNNNNNNDQQKQSAARLLEAPAPKPPQVSKMELYNSDEPDVVFRDIDQLAINVAKEDQQSFTDLVHHLTRHCLTDIEKARAIFRWITVKNLNTMQFDSSVKADTPLGLLRGIKNGSESYHVLFKRLCSYAGLHCVVIKGFSKSAGYQPGVRFEGNRFRNSWNAVFVAGAWRFVQCNWGARHLVSVAVMQDKSQGAAGKTQSAASARQAQAVQPSPPPPLATGIVMPNKGGRSQSASSGQQCGRRGLSDGGGTQFETGDKLGQFERLEKPISPTSSHSSSATTSSSSASCSSHRHHSQSHHHHHHHHHHHQQQHHKALRQHQRQSPAGSALDTTPTGARGANNSKQSCGVNSNSDSLRYEYDDHYFLTDPDEFIYEFFPLSPEWQLIKSRPISLEEFERLPFVRSLFFKYGLYFPQPDIRSVLLTDSSGATTIKIGMPTHMVPSLIFHYNLKYYDSDLETYEGVSLKRFVMQSVESGAGDGAQNGLLSNVVSFRVHLPENGAYILDIFANSTTPTQYITGEPMKFKSVCKFKIIAKQLKTVMVPLPDCASGEFGPMKATRLFGIIPLTHESGLISVQNEKRHLEIQFRMTRPLLDFMASLHKNVKFPDDGQYGLDIYTRDQQLVGGNPNGDSRALANAADRKDFNTSSIAANTNNNNNNNNNHSSPQADMKRQLLTHCCKYLINVRTPGIISNRL